jgi:hypothetical protein
MFRGLYQGFKQRIFARRVYRWRLYCHDLQSIPEIPRNPTDHVTRLDPAHVETVLEVYPADLAQDIARLASGKTCYIGYAGSRAAHFTWVQDKGVYLLADIGPRERIRAGDFWIFSSRTADWARGRHIFPITVAFILREYRANGYERAFAYVAEENKASIHGMERAGFVVRKRMRTLLVSRYVFALPW